MKKTILFVDDEVQILRALKRLFYKEKYILLVAESGKKALEILDENQVDMLVTDMRMPEMDGYELLTKVRARYPDIVRIALSGYTDKKIVLSTLDKNLAKIYLYKPWNNDELIKIIDRLFEFEEELKDKKVLDIISKFENLPTIPRLHEEISNMVEEEKPIAQISKKIETDHAIAARILRISNSAYFGSKTGDIKQAIMFIGLMNVKNIILSNEIYSVNSGESIVLELEFRHSSLTNKIMNDLYSEVIKKPLGNESKSAGLLHNIGKGVLYKNYSGVYNLKPDDIEFEQKEIGTTHQMIGGYILNWWELPLPIVECALYHHTPDDDKIINKELVSVVHISQNIAWRILGVNVEEKISELAMERIGITEKKLLEYLKSHLKKEM